MAQPAGTARRWMAGLVALLFFVVAIGSLALRPATAELPRQTETATDGRLLDAYELAAEIDRALSTRWIAEKVTPAGNSSDSEFLRRVYLDLVGKIPTVAETRSFLGDTRTDKRRRLVDDLLQRGARATHFANVWRELLLANVNNASEGRALAPQLDAWLRLRFSANVSYDQLVTELLTATTAAVQRSSASASAPSPLAYYDANERKPEQLAASASRIFLGVQVQCAQCHDHPFNQWKRTDFWSLAAFFGGLEQPDQMSGSYPPLVDRVDHEGIHIPDTELVAEAKFLDGATPNWEATPTKRAALARWLTASGNPFFARAAVNRVWDHLFGCGLVTPVDDLDPTHSPSHPELFDLVTRQFVLHKFDINYLLRAIAATRAYQLSSRQAGKVDDNLQRFAHMPLRRLSADQLFDSLVVATGYREAPADRRAAAAQNLTSARSEFQTKFAGQSVPRTEAETSILQALSLMNGRFTTTVTDLESSETLAAVIDAPFLDTRGRIETLYLATFNRPPEADELATVEKYLTSRGADGVKRAYADVFWALLNSAEFNLNH